MSYILRPFLGHHQGKKQIKGMYFTDMVRDSSVGIATTYGSDGPGIETWWGRDFPHLSRRPLRPTQLPVQGC